MSSGKEAPLGEPTLDEHTSDDFKKLVREYLNQGLICKTDLDLFKFWVKNPTATHTEMAKAIGYVTQTTVTRRMKRKPFIELQLALEGGLDDHLLYAIRNTARNIGKWTEDPEHKRAVIGGQMAIGWMEKQLERQQNLPSQEAKPLTPEEARQLLREDPASQSPETIDVQPLDSPAEPEVPAQQDTPQEDEPES